MGESFVGYMLFARRAIPRGPCEHSSRWRLREEIGDAVARRLLFATREEHVNAVRLAFSGCGVDLRSSSEGAAGAHDSESVRRSRGGHMQLGDARPVHAGASGRRRRYIGEQGGARSRSPREPVRTIKELRRARPWRYFSLNAPARSSFCTGRKGCAESRSGRLPRGRGGRRRLRWRFRFARR